MHDNFTERMVLISEGVTSLLIFDIRVSSLRTTTSVGRGSSLTVLSPGHETKLETKVVWSDRTSPFWYPDRKVSLRKEYKEETVISHSDLTVLCIRKEEVLFRDVSFQITLVPLLFSQGKEK